MSEDFYQRAQHLKDKELKTQQKLLKSPCTISSISKNIHIFVATNKCERACILKVELDFHKSKK